MSWTKFIRPLQRRFRLKRAERIRERFPDIEGKTIVDIGGSLTFWEIVKGTVKPGKVLIYNTSSDRMTMGRQATHGFIETHIYDGLRIPLDDKSADYVICNSVIEHVPLDARENLANEIVRVAKQFVVQTPAPSFPVELHFGLPLIHWLPRRLGRALVPLSPFGLLSGVDTRAYFDQTQLLPRGELQGYFPGASLEVERLAGIPKSYLVFG